MTQALCSRCTVALVKRMLHVPLACTAGGPYRLYAPSWDADI